MGWKMAQRVAYIINSASTFNLCIRIITKRQRTEWSALIGISTVLLMQFQHI